MKTRDTIIYPVIITEIQDNEHYYTVTSPNIEGMITRGKTFSDAATKAEDAIATILNEGSSYPEVQDPTTWEINDNEKIVYINVNMTKWRTRNTQTIRTTITMPEYLSVLARKNNINVSRVATEALKKKLKI
ncbi:type II toxin-antitoxin system HicB family antitoxin [Lactobacillus sp. YT155]|uniref:type II toxin-antitoxin system HicB family antitoxin n=1 Tax=Lactobacillus sp. YT155 TaxID=3060955 RepID=UPI0026601E2C|nr:type II toxin-antitoxin system HicB family antitoxin [Lactobacillus sp. YT155]MDO1605243.1 type II toxin-antitoxin system HicB family antitoxin [Lactobacillus sp. YT155]